MSSMTILIKAFLRFPSPPTVSACGGVRASLGERDIAGREKVANTVEAGLSIHIEAVICGEIKGAECFASLRCTLQEVLVEHLFPRRRMQVGGVRDDTVEVEQDGVVLVAGD